MMPIRPSVETWNRGELEDKFYRQYDQLIAVKKRNNELEKKLKLSSSRIRQALESGNASETDERNLELERENRLLAQKLKALRHQLIAYTRPQAHNTTLNFLTSRSTGRPRSGVPAESGRPQGPDEHQQSQVPHDGIPPISHGNNIQRPIIDERHVQIISPNHHIIEPPLPPTEEKQQIIKLYRENREKDGEIDELNSRLSKNEEKLETLRIEYDKIIQELENSNLRVHQLQRTINQKPQESTDLLEKELTLLKQENKVIKAANDRFVHNSLVDSTSTKETSTELQALQKHVHEVEMKVTEIENENKQLSKKLKSAESEKKSISSKYKKLKEKIAKKEEKRKEQASMQLQHQHQQQQLPQTIPEKEESEAEAESEASSIIAESPVPKYKPSKTSSKRRHSNHLRTFEPSVLDRVFEDVASIVNSHISRTESSASLDNEFGANTRWRQMYESVYSELEKLRNLLMIQHRICERQKKEILILNDSNESNKHEYEKKLGEFVLELNRRAKRIEILENQLRSIANGATDFDRSILSDTSINNNFIDFPTTLSTTEMTLRLKKLTITESGLKHTSSIDPMLFLSLEFFDFELQTTPLIQGPESVFEYSTVYDILISNLFIHYMETEGITIELFEVKGVAYDQKGTGIISLKKLLETETPAMISGKLRLFLPGSKETVMAQLEYQLEVPFSLIKALKAQKRRLTASSYLPLDSSIPSTLYNEIEILIHRCSNLQVLTKSKQLPSTYVAYQIYDLQPHLTQIQSKNANPVYNDSRAFTLPIGMALHRYLKTEELQIYVVEENSERANRGKELGSIILPLFPLARNQSIKGTFSLTTSDGQVSEATIDLSIYWKYAYTFNDENVEVEEPIPVKFPKWKPVVQESPKLEPEKTKTPPKLSSPESSSPERERQFFQSPGHRRPAPKPPIHHPSYQELPQPAVPSSVPHLNVPSSSSSIESSSGENTIIENANAEESHFDPDISPQRPPTAPAMIESDESSSDDTYVVDDDDLQDSELQQKVRETSIDEIPDIPRDDEPAPPPNNRQQPQPESTPTPPESEIIKEETEKNDILRKLTKMSPPTESEESSEGSSTDGSEAPEIIGLKEELEKLGKEIEEDSGITRNPEPPKPPLRLPPIAPPRRTTGRLEFKDPLHTSVPPSEESSVAGSISGSPRPRVRTIYKSTPDLAARATSSSIKQFEQPLRPDIPHIDCSVTIRLGRLSLVEHSPLLDEVFENLNVFIEWSFLDFSSDLCETPESVPLPRNTWKVETFECEKIYELNSRRTALLKQWIDLNTRLSFNLVSDPSDDGGDCDDLGVAQLDLSDVINTSVHSIVFHDVDGEPIAVLDLSIIYSDELTKMLLIDEKEEE